MILRPALSIDSKRIEEIAKDHPFPFFPESLLTVVAEEDCEIVAVGQLLSQVEVSLMSNKKRSKAERVRALQILMQEAMFQTNKLGIAQLHSFVKDEKFAEILQKHWGFIPTAKALVLNL